MSRRMRAVPVYLTYLTCSGFFFQMMSVVFSLFLILRLDLGPFQLVLLGTILEGTYLLFETPTGVVADTIGRRASVIIGLTGGGIGFILLGLSTTFWMAAASQVIWGIFATFESGADVAWLTDEVGEEAARPLYVRGNQFGTWPRSSGSSPGSGSRRWTSRCPSSCRAPDSCCSRWRSRS